MYFEDETPFADSVENDGDEQGYYDPSHEVDNEYNEGYSSDADDFESRELAADLAGDDY
ncbi:hypothetical protein [Hymenobacter sp. DG01]|uniref:hypothetical protein n=1 Tax=Hymenobacter sp. DG01 TaxID=2584940 RepID=UPI0015DF2FD1|nr:hypothetical protein [Hymenobacter sp. DG01]